MSFVDVLDSHRFYPAKLIQLIENVNSPVVILCVVRLIILVFDLNPLFSANRFFILDIDAILLIFNFYFSGS
ncbi:hypothetical protein D3C73_1563320 [compost metagenome]